MVSKCACPLPEPTVVSILKNIKQILRERSKLICWNFHDNRYHVHQSKYCSLPIFYFCVYLKWFYCLHLHTVLAYFQFNFSVNVCVCLLKKNSSRMTAIIMKAIYCYGQVSNKVGDLGSETEVIVTLFHFSLLLVYFPIRT